MAIVHLLTNFKGKETMSKKITVIMKSGKVFNLSSATEEKTTLQLTGREKVKALADKAGLCPSQKFDFLSRNEKRAIKTKLKKRKLL